MIVGVSGVMRSYGLIVALAGVLQAIWSGTGLNSNNGKRVWGGAMLRAPVIGNWWPSCHGAILPDARHVA